MPVYRYFRAEDGKKNKAGPDTDSLLKALSRKLTENYKLETAFEKIKWDGFLDEEQRVDGLSRMLEQVRRFREGLLATYRIDRVLDQVRRRFELFYASQNPSSGPTTDSGGDNPSGSQEHGDGAKPPMKNGILSGFPDDPGSELRRIAAVDDDNEARAALLRWGKEVWRKLSGIRFLLHESNIDHDPVPIPALDSFAEVLDLRGDARTEALLAFLAEFPGVLAIDKGVIPFVHTVQMERAAVKTLMASLPFQVRLALESVEPPESSEALRQSLRRLFERFDRISPLTHVKAYEFTGSQPLTLDAAFQVALKLRKLEMLEDSLTRAHILGDLDQVNRDLVGELLGELAEASLDNLQRLVDVLVQAGYLQVEQERMNLTGKAVRRIRELSFLDLICGMNLPRGMQKTRHRSRALHSLSGSSKKYAYGDPWNLDPSATILSALGRKNGKGRSVRIGTEDFRVYEPEYDSLTASVLLIDLSSSMDERLPQAKNVAMNLQELLRRKFRGDRLHIVGFYSLARILKPEELLTARTMPYNPLPFPKTISMEALRTQEREGGPDFLSDFTNLQEGLRLCRRILSRQPHLEKRIFLITDAEPTACEMDGTVFLESEATPMILSETLKEAARCTKEGIRITTFMLSEDEGMQQFVSALGKENKGKALFAASEDLAQMVIVDYLKNKQRAVG